MTTVKDLVVALKAETKGFDRQIKRSRKRVDGFTKSASAGFANVHRAALAMSAGIGIALKSGIDHMVDFESSFARFAARTGGDMAALEHAYGDAVDQISVLTGVAATDVVDAFTLAVSAGASGQRAIDLVTRAAKSQAAQLASAALAVDAATTVADTFAESYTAGLNAITVASTAGKGGVDDFAKAAKATGPLASSLGVSLSDTAAALAEISLKGAGIVEGTTQLKQFLGGLLKPTAEAEKALKALGASLGLPDYDAEAVRKRLAAGGLVDVLREFKALDKGQLGRIFDRTALEFVLAVDPDSIADLSRRVESGLADATSRAFDQGEQSLDRYLSQLRARWDAATRSANEPLLKTFQGIQAAIVAGGGDVDAVFASIANWLGHATGAIAKFLVLLYEYRGLVSWIVGGTAALVAALAAWHLLRQAWLLLLPVAKLIVTAVLPALIEAFLFMATTVLPAVGRAFLGIATKVLPALVSPIAGIVAAVGVFAYAASVVYRAWEPIAGFFGALWGGIEAGAQVVWLHVRNAFLGLKDDLLLFLSTLGEKINSVLAGIPGIDWQLPTLDEDGQKALADNQAARQAELAKATDQLTKHMDSIGGALGDAASAVADIVAGDIETVKAKWRGAVDGAGDLAGEAVDFLGEAVDFLGDAANAGWEAYKAKYLAPLRSGFPGASGARAGYSGVDGLPAGWFAAMGLPEPIGVRRLPYPLPPPAPDAEPPAAPDFEPPAETAASSLADSLREAFRAGDLSDVGQIAWQKFRATLLDTFFDNVEAAFGNLFDSDPSTGFWAGLLNFDGGGEVPGPQGRPRLAVVHGGEVVMTPAQQRGQGGVTINQSITTTGDFDERVLRALQRRNYEAAAIVSSASR